VTAVRSASGQLISGERSQHVELVTIRVAHDHPADVALADVEEAGAERLQPGDLGGLVHGPKVQVQPVLDDLAFRQGFMF
jgi:hypothetical protein